MESFFHIAKLDIYLFTSKNYCKIICFTWPEENFWLNLHGEQDAQTNISTRKSIDPNRCRQNTT